MALKLKIIDNKGIDTSYHRIRNITTSDTIKVIVDSYTDESYRQKERDIISLIERQELLKKQLQIEMDKTNDAYNKEKIIELTESINEIGFLHMENLAVFAKEFEFELNKNEMISFKTVYEMLKNTDLFYNAEDLIDETVS